MCGIAGIWNVDIPSPLGQVGDMLDAMRHRGPDGRGTLEFRGGAAGMVRLALVDLSDRGQQPIWSADNKVAIIFNGEMYNFREERSRLSRDYQFRSTTDTEVVLNLYLERGLQFVDRIRGMYGLAIFDWREMQPGGLPVMTLVRGPLGIKPLYAATPVGNPQGVVFASEIRGMLASGLTARSVDQAGLLSYLGLGFVLQPHTLVEGVRMLEPGSIERYVPGQPVHHERFWRMPAFAPRKETLDEAAERLRSVLEESVRLHALADAPVGAFLSGGVDSTGIVGLMRKHVSDLRTYTLRFPDVPGAGEAVEAAAAAKTFECHNTIVDVTGREVADLLPQFARELDQPSADGLNTWLISRAAARDVKGVLSGLGGDEWFAGYPVVRRMALYSTTRLGRAQALAGRLAGLLGGIVPPGRLQNRLDNLITRKSPLTTWLQTHTVFKASMAGRLAGVSPQSQEHAFKAMLDDVRADWNQESVVGLACLLDTRVYLISQLLRDSDATSMAHSLELRVPLVDREVVNFSRTCADEFKLRPDGGFNYQYAGSGSKRVLIHALRDLLPPEMATRPKRGFSLPIEHWARGAAAPLLAETCSREAVTNRGLVNPDMVEKIWQDARSGRPGCYYPHLWTLMMLELWCRTVLDPAPSASAASPVA